MRYTLGSNIQVNPLTKIINESISKGEFPKAWKEAVVTPVLKKGNPELLEMLNSTEVSKV